MSVSKFILRIFDCTQADINRARVLSVLNDLVQVCQILTDSRKSQHQICRSSAEQGLRVLLSSKEQTHTAMLAAIQYGDVEILKFCVEILDHLEERSATI